MGIMAAVWVCLDCAASHRYENYELFVSPAGGEWLVGTGDNVEFDVTVMHDNMPLESGEVKYEVSEDMMSPRQQGMAHVRRGKARIKGGTMRKPGFLRCRVEIREGGMTYSASGTCGFDVDKLRPVVEIPDDFEEFWKRAVSEVRDSGLLPRKRHRPDMSTDYVDVYEVSFACGHPDKRIYGMLAVPKTRTRMPGVVMYPGAGVYPIKPAMDLADNGVISLSIGIHGIPGDLDPGVYRNLDYGALQSYQTCNMDDRDRYYYRRVIQGCVRAVDYLLSLPECNGNVGTYGGSQGGFLSIAVAALHPDIRFLVAHFPAMSDLPGYIHGRAGGWPHIFKDDRNRNEATVNALAYYDTANFARLVKVPGFYTFGYNDTTCPPTSVQSVFNVIKSPKEIMVAPATEHYTFTEQYRTSVDRVTTFLKSMEVRDENCDASHSR